MTRKKIETVEELPQGPQVEEVQVVQGLEDQPVTGRRRDSDAVQMRQTSRALFDDAENALRKVAANRRNRIEQYARTLSFTLADAELLYFEGNRRAPNDRDELIQFWARMRWQMATAMVDNTPVEDV